MSELRLDRRSFLAGLAKVTAVATFPVTFGGFESALASSKRADALCWVAINNDNSVTLTIPQSEIGQAVTTTISQMLAEELEVSWSSIHTEFFDPNVNIDNNNVYVWTATLGSMSAHYLFDPARLAAAQIRTMLVKAAAMRGGWKEAELVASVNYVHHRGTGKKLSYAELAERAVQLQPPPADQIEFKPASEWRLVGKSAQRLDLKASTNGEMEYGIDVELPGMRRAAIRQCPVVGGTLENVDETGLAGLPGSPVVVRLKGAHVGYNSPVPEGEDPELWATPVFTSDAVAVVADSWWQARRALDSLEMEWGKGEGIYVSSDELLGQLSGKLDTGIPTLAARGDVAAAMQSAEVTHRAEYLYPYMEPAPLEPVNCTVVVTDSSASVWAGTQYAEEGLRIVSELTGLPRGQVNFHLMGSGGGFGRRCQNDYIYQATQIALAMPGTPVQLLWDREESVQKSFYVPLTLTRYEGAISRDGTISAWVCRVASVHGADQAFGATEFPFYFPNSRIEYDRSTPSPLPFGWMRGVGYTQHLWMNIGFMDELVRLAGRDPAEVYRDLLQESRVPPDIEHYEIAIERVKTLRNVLERTLELTKWGQGKRAGNVGRGLAISDSEYYAGYGSSSTKAAVVDVTITGEGALTINKVFVAIDCGTVINPDVVKAQLQGGVAYALTNALHSEITLKDGRVEQSNFHDYPVLRMHEMPEVEIVILPGKGAPMSVGEDSVPITIAALVNAIADAGGPRIRSLPIKTA